MSGPQALLGGLHCMPNRQAPIPEGMENGLQMAFQIFDFARRMEDQQVDIGVGAEFFAPVAAHGQQRYSLSRRRFFVPEKGQGSFQEALDDPVDEAGPLPAELSPRQAFLLATPQPDLSAAQKPLDILETLRAFFRKLALFPFPESGSP